MQGPQFQSPVGELRSHVWHDQKWKKKKKKVSSSWPHCRPGLFDLCGSQAHKLGRVGSVVIANRLPKSNLCWFRHSRSSVFIHESPRRVFLALPTLSIWWLGDPGSFWLPPSVPTALFVSVLRERRGKERTEEAQAASQKPWCGRGARHFCLHAVTENSVTCLRARDAGRAVLEEG